MIPVTVMVTTRNEEANIERWNGQFTGPDGKRSVATVANHTINGVRNAAGIVGPNLTHFASRTTFAGATFDNTQQNLELWLRDPPAMKPGADMPNLHLTQEQINALIAYLETLK